MRDTIPVGRIAGCPVRVHWSVVVILLLFTWSLATSLPSTVEGCSTAAYWLAGFCGALMLLASLVAHELAHVVVARRWGVSVVDITLWLVGGMSTLGGEAKTPKAALRIAIAGPVLSLALAAAFGGLVAAVHTAGAAPIVVGVAYWLGVTNLLMGLFNLLPAAPLDGGRMLRALLWRRRGDLVRASLSAAHTGQVMAFVLIASGLAEFMAGGFVGGVWLAFIGWFIFAASREEQHRIIYQEAFAGVRVADVMTARPYTAPESITVDDFIQRYVPGQRHSAYPVTDPDGSIVGLVTLNQLRDLKPDRRATTRVGDIALPLTALATAVPHELLTALLQRMSAARPRARALVFDGGQLVGIVTQHDLVRLIDGPAHPSRQPRGPHRRGEEFPHRLRVPPHGYRHMSTRSAEGA